MLKQDIVIQRPVSIRYRFQLMLSNYYNQSSSFLYPWVYSSQGLKAKKVKIKAGVTIGPERHRAQSVVQKNRVKTLQRHRQTLEQKWWRSLLTRKTAEFVTEITQELQSWEAEGTQIPNSNRLKSKIRCQVAVYGKLPLSRHFCYRPHTGCCPVNVRLSFLLLLFLFFGPPAQSLSTWIFKLSKCKQLFIRRSWCSEQKYQ